MQKKALGRGLETLIPIGRPAAAREDGQDIREIPLSQISPNPYQPRRLFDDSTLRELADSVRTKGVIQPVLVRRLGDGQFELIAGERRLRAARLAGLQKIPSIVRPATDTESIEIALIENLQRKDLNPIEEAKAYHRLMKEFGLTQEELSARLGKERSSIANTARLLSLPAEVQAWVEEERLSLGHAKVLLGIEDETQQIRLGRQAVKERLSVRDLERLLMKAPRAGSRHSGRKVRPSALEDQLTRRLGTKVRLIEGKIGGKIVVEYYSAAELDRLVDLLLG
jgi:ParB family transcriptional regulator, chromosome partitioning protein